MLIAPDGPACGANVLGVTRDGATAWALAKPAVIERQTAAEAIANHLLRSRRRALCLLRPNLLSRRCCYRSQIPQRTKKRNRFVADLGENSTGGAEISLRCHQGHTSCVKLAVAGCNGPAAPWPDATRLCNNAEML